MYKMLDQLLLSNLQQNMAIETLKAENVALKQQLCAVYSKKGSPNLATAVNAINAVAKPCKFRKNDLHWYPHVIN